jgi:hypothetical protein
MRIIVCEKAFLLLDDFSYKASAHWHSGRLADALGYSEPELLYRVGFLDKALQEAKDIYWATWIQMSIDNYY